MELEKQVCSVELATKLNVLGAKQESAFYWTKNAKYGLQLVATRYPKEDSEENGMTDGISAFTVAELGELLPCKVSREDWLQIQKGAAGFNVDYGHQDSDGSYYAVKEVMSASEADARAKMLIHLLENGLVQAAQVGQ